MVGEYTLVKSNLLQEIYMCVCVFVFLQYVCFRDFPLNSANIAAEILHVHGVSLILT